MRIAITGGIGSGKSEVCGILKSMGANTVSADLLNRELLNDSEYLIRLRQLFPEAFLDGKFDKRKLASIVFDNSEKLNMLNALAHPEIRKKIVKYAKDGLVFCEMPLLNLEWAREFDRVWLVTNSDLKNRIERVKKRDGRSKEEVEKIIASQVVYSDIIYPNCTIINNDGDFNNLKSEVEKAYCLLNAKY